MSRLSLILLLLLSGCQLAPDAKQGWVALGSGHFQLADSWPAPAQQLLQQAVWQDAKEQHQFIISALLKPEAMLLVALSPLGQELWRVQYQQGHQLETSGIAPFNQPQFAAMLLSQMQLALLQPEQLIPRLAQLKLQQGQAERIIYSEDGTELLKISQPGSIIPGQTMQITSAQYSLRITTLQRDILP